MRHPRSSAAPLLLVGLLTACCCSSSEGTPRGPETHHESYPESDIVHPVKVDSSGSFLTYDLAYRGISKRNLGLRDGASSRLYYGFNYGGQGLRLNLTVNPNLLAPGYVRERRYGGIAQAQIQHKAVNTCHLLGEIQGHTGERGLAAVSTCDGLRGVFQLSDDEYFIEPLDGPTARSPDSEANPDPRETAPRPHRVYRRHVPERRGDSRGGSSEAESSQQVGTCAVRESPRTLDKTERRRESWEAKQKKRQKRPQRSISKEKWVETLVVADTKMVEYHGTDNVEHYILTVMNMVAGLFHDPSIGNPINIVIVRLVLLEAEEEELKITHHADNTLRSFCKWQKMANIKGDAHPTHHDVAVLITRKDICAAMNRPCETLGLSHVSGMCQPHRSCNLNEDTGLPLAFTIAHELGHSFGIQHDGNGNDCEPVGKRPFIMSPQLLYDTSPLTWSRCSQDYITRFLDRGWGLCLDDPPTTELIDYPSVPPGVLYDVGHQCRLQYGSLSTFCQDIDNVCNTLWCTVGFTCHSKLDAAVDGTKCGENKWCFNGDCVPVGYRLGSINGGWGSWSLWSSCSQTCGAGVQYAERQCSSPTPKYGGKYCLGERKRYRICNIKPCPEGKPTFRHMQCSRFNSVQYKGKLYTWIPLYNMGNPCELHCRPEGEYFSEKLLDAVIDGTPCYEGNASRDVCINGICKNVGCDYEIDSGAVEDRCGVCHGNASTCQTVKKTFDESEGLGYVDIGLIPSGAREIRIEEVAEAGNFLALRGEDPENYFLNGGWTIQWNGEYDVAGTTFTYERQGDLENLSSPGPTREPVWIQLLFQETNPGVRFEYIIHRELDNDNEIPPPDFSWRYGSWTKCTATCGTGVQRQIVFCVEKFSGIVEERYCDSRNRPDDQQRNCSQEPCPARWWVGEWQTCSSTCGELGLVRRAVLCTQSVALDEHRALPAAECGHLRKPESSAPCNREIHCPSDWEAGNWSECSATCGSGLKLRPVYCKNNTGAACNISEKPVSENVCNLPECPKPTVSFTPEWQGSGISSHERFNEIGHIPDRPIPKGIPKHHSENIIPEDGFMSIHSKKNGGHGNSNAFVDDFYYDYNFINFHEDLSYDSSREKNGPTTESYETKGISVDITKGYSPTPPTLLKKNGGLGLQDSMGNETDDASGILGANLTKHETQNEENVFIVTNTEKSVNISKATSTITYISGSEQHLDKTLSVELPSLREQGTLFNSSQSTAEKEREHTQIIPVVPKHDALVTVAIPSVPPSTLLPAIDESFKETQEENKDTVRSVGNEIPDNHHTISDDDEGTEQSTKSTFSGSLSKSDSSHWNDQEPEPKVTVSSLGQTSENIQPEPELYLVATSLPVEAFPSTAEYVDHPTKEEIEEDMSGRRSPPGSDQTRGTADKEPRDPSVYSRSTQMYTALTDTTHIPPVISTASTKYPTQVPISRISISNKASASALPTSDWNSIAHTQGTGLQLSTSISSQRDPSAWPDSNELPVSYHFENLPLPSSSSDWGRDGVGGRLGSLPATVFPSNTIQDEIKTVVTRISSTPKEEGTQPTVSKAYWEVGNWTKCSTTCGLGAIWRTVTCTGGKDIHCDIAKKPIPARRCYLRPCSVWRVGNWTKCSRNCGGGTTVRDVQCVDARDERLLRPFHCQSMLHKPPSEAACQPKPCMDWYTSSWRECSESCGGGAQERLVTCPEFGRCDDSARPNNTRPCNTHPCTKWVVGSWGQCTASCGGGIQRRLVKCVNTKTGETEEDSNLCDHEPWPENTQKCNPQDCEHTESSFHCERDHLSFSFCQTLRLLGRCHLPTVKVQCCRTCFPHSSGTRDRGNERVSRR
ncbi:A disintegrin and metalloproteinase with thrombospondin motifs 7 [Pleurodeles waltl]|uniref:A disintegrin and metalloproteinase with thrombospondin motifs 7 n=1 Tax=Pleurodeles waltl TaxID=8319 RepID=UPI0037097D1B